MAASGSNRNSNARRWCFTLNNPTVEELINVELCDYLVYGTEVGENGTTHHQGYACFKKPYRLSGVKKILSRAHWEVARGSPTEASVYCKKDGVYVEFGTLPTTSSNRMAATNKRNWDAAFESAKKGDFESISAHMKIQYYHAFKRIKQDYMQPAADLEDVSGIWYYGPSGVGKSRLARLLHPGFYQKPANKWWDGYQEQPYVLIEDIDKVHNVLSHHFKLWADRYSFPAEMKGTTVQIRPKKIVVTSNYHPGEIFLEDATLLTAIERRFVITHFPEPIDFTLYQPLASQVENCGTQFNFQRQDTEIILDTPLLSPNPTPPPSPDDDRTTEDDMTIE